MFCTECRAKTVQTVKTARTAQAIARDPPKRPLSGFPDFRRPHVSEPVRKQLWLSGPGRWPSGELARDDLPET